MKSDYFRLFAPKLGQEKILFTVCSSDSKSLESLDLTFQMVQIAPGPFEILESKT